MPFGLTNAPATWQRIMDTTLDPELEPHVFVYLDDVIIISNNFTEHLELLATVFQRLREAGLVVSVEKCHFCRPELRYLGYIVDPDGLRQIRKKLRPLLTSRLLGMSLKFDAL